MENMVFKRKIYSQMAEWKEISKGSTALLVAVSYTHLTLPTTLSV